MPPLSKANLLNRVLSAIEISGWQSFVLRQVHPFRLRVSQEPLIRSLIIYIWNLTSGGPSTVRPSGEFRIQITGVVPPLLSEANSQTLLLGWHDEYEVFAAFDSRRHRTFSGRSPSIQVHISAMNQAVQYGFGFYQRSNEEIVVLFTPDQFMNYVLNQENFHRFGHSTDETEIISSATQHDPTSEDIEIIPIERRELVHSVRTWVRQRDFRERVLTAYQHQCAVCQMQLRLVQAAHIVPVHAPGSNDLTRNGLALCATHHQAYDGGLVGIAPNYHIIVNEARLNQIREEGLSAGEESVLQYVCNTIVVPSSPSDHPDPEYLAQGLQLRGWELEALS